jgi:chemotaxis protein CheX
VETVIETFQLPSVLDLSAAAPLREHFIGRRGAPLRVDASRVERLGGLCLQVLIAARAAWAEDRHALTFDDVSSELQAGLDIFGVPPLALNYREE